jgi:hypothetical protein
MGLDAVVYRNRAHIELGSDASCAKIDQQTGEVYFEDDRLARKFDHKREAASFRLGNIAAIAEIDVEAGRLLGADSTICQKITYSGTHCGDRISPQDFAKLFDELGTIRRSGSGSPLLLEFVGAMEELVRAANEEKNPIVFV